MERWIDRWIGGQIDGCMDAWGHTWTYMVCALYLCRETTSLPLTFPTSAKHNEKLAVPEEAAGNVNAALTLSR